MSNISQNFKTKAKRGLSCATPATKMAGGGIISKIVDGAKDMLSSVTAPATTISRPAPAAPTPAPAAPAPAQQAPSIGGAVNSIRERQRMLNNLAAGGVIGNAAEYWANDNAEFEKTNPNFGRRVLRSVNPLTGFGSAMGAMHTAAGNGDIPGMAMAGISAIPAFGVLRAVPATGAIKAGVHSSPSLGRSAATVAGGATANAAADEYQAKKEGGYATGGVVGAKTFEFEGKGTGTSDDIPVKVAGNHINVSDGEKAVVLPAKTAQNPQALDMIEDIIQQSNDGRAPNRGLRSGAGYEDGVIDRIKSTARHMVTSPDQRAIEAGNATPEQVDREAAGMKRAHETDSPFDVPLVSSVGTPARAVVDAAPGMLSKGMSMASNAGASVASAVAPLATKARNLFRHAPVAPAAAAAEAAPLATAAGAAAATAAAPTAARQWSPEAAAYIAARDAPVIPQVRAAAERIPLGSAGSVSGQVIARPAGVPSTQQDGALPEQGATQAQPVSLPAPTQAYPMSTPGGPVAPEAAPTRRGLDPAKMLDDSSYVIPSGTGAIRSSNGKALLIDSRPEMEAKAAAAKAAEPDMTTSQGVLKRAETLLTSGNADQRVMGAKLMRHAYPQMLASETHRYSADKSFEGHRLTATAQQGLAGVEQARKDDENRRQERDAYRKSLEPQFMRAGKDGKQEVDQTALGEFERLAASTIAARYNEAQGADKKRWSSNFDGKARSVAELDDADKSALLKNFRMRALHAKGAGGLPWDNDRADSTDLMDWEPTVKGDQVEFQRLTARNGGKTVGGNVKNYKYGEPVGYFETQLGKTPTNEFLPTKAR